MSKDLKLNIKKLVETVENLQHLLSWISSSIKFWHYDSIFPMNLIKKCCDDYYTDLEIFLSSKNPF